MSGLQSQVTLTSVKLVGKRWPSETVLQTLRILPYHQISTFTFAGFNRYGVTRSTMEEITALVRMTGGVSDFEMNPVPNITDDALYDAIARPVRHRVRLGLDPSTWKDFVLHDVPNCEELWLHVVADSEHRVATPTDTENGTAFWNNVTSSAYMKSLVLDVDIRSVALVLPPDALTNRNLETIHVNVFLSCEETESFSLAYLLSASRSARVTLTAASSVSEKCVVNSFKYLLDLFHNNGDLLVELDMRRCLPSWMSDETAPSHLAKQLGRVRTQSVGTRLQLLVRDDARQEEYQKYLAAVPFPVYVQSGEGHAANVRTGILNVRRYFNLPNNVLSHCDGGGSWELAYLEWTTNRLVLGKLLDQTSTQGLSDLVSKGASVTQFPVVLDENIKVWSLFTVSREPCVYIAVCTIGDEMAVRFVACYPRGERVRVALLASGLDVVDRFKPTHPAPAQSKVAWTSARLVRTSGTEPLRADATVDMNLGAIVDILLQNDIRSLEGSLRLPTEGSLLLYLKAICNEHCAFVATVSQQNGDVDHYAVYRRDDRLALDAVLAHCNMGR